MDKPVRRNINKTLKAHYDPAYDELEEIMESDLEDYEIAAELGISPSQVSNIRRQLFED